MLMALAYLVWLAEDESELVIEITESGEVAAGGWPVGVVVQICTV